MSTDFSEDQEFISSYKLLKSAHWIFQCRYLAATLYRVFSGSKERTFFLSFPNRLVNSYFPVPLLSAGFRSSQTSNPTPQDLISVTSFFKWMPQASLEVFSKSSSLPQSMTSVIMLSSITSITRSSRCNSSTMTWSRSMFRSGTFTQQ